MGSREFIVALVDQGAWPLVVIVLVGILLISQRKPIGKLLDRDVEAKAEAPGLSIEVSARHRLVAAIEEAAQPSDQLLRLVDGDRVQEVAEQYIADRRLDIEHVAEAAAVWGQMIARHPLGKAGIWHPTITWTDDGRVDLSGGPYPQWEATLVHKEQEAHAGSPRVDASGNDHVEK